MIPSGRFIKGTLLSNSNFHEIYRYGNKWNDHKNSFAHVSLQQNKA